MSKKTVKHSIDSSNIPPLSAKQKAEIKAAALPDSAIDYSDIPPLTDKFWKNAVCNPFYKPTKKTTTIRIDLLLVGKCAECQGDVARVIESS